MWDHSWLVKQLLTCDKLCAFGRWMLIAYSRTAATYSVILHEANYHVHTGQWRAHHFLSIGIDHVGRALHSPAVN